MRASSAYILLRTHAGGASANKTRCALSSRVSLTQRQRAYAHGIRDFQASSTLPRIFYLIARRIVIGAPYGARTVCIAAAARKRRSRRHQ